MDLFVAGVNHRTATLPIRERLYVSDSKIPALLQTLLLRGSLEGGAILSTCNRFEVYGVTSTPETSLIGLENFFSEKSGFSVEELEGRWYAHTGKEAIQHLFRVACGLDSMILGETEIQGQVRNAYEKARSSGFTGSVLNRLFEKSLNAAKAVREEVGLTNGKSSIGSYAIEVAQKIFGQTLPSKRLLILGAGEIGKLVSRHFASAGITSLTIVNRSYDHASELVKGIGGRAASFEELPMLLPESDIVVSAARCPHLLVTAQAVKEALHRRWNGSIFFIDLSVPRTIDPLVHQLPGAYLFHLDDLERMVATRLNVRHEDLKQCEEIIEKKAAYFMEWFKRFSGEAIWGQFIKQTLPVSS